MSENMTDTDLIVAGGGMAGLVAAVRALQQDSDVIVLEKGNRAGGSMYFSPGEIWTYDSYERLREDIPNGDAVLQEIILNTIEKAYEWLEDLGVKLTDVDSNIPGSGKKIEPAEFTDRFVKQIEEEGGEIRYETPLSELREQNGRIESVKAIGPDGDEILFDTDSVILATGGFQGNPALVEQYITENSGNLWLRSNPWSTGDGIESAKAIGANLTKGMGTFYGHNLPAPPATFSPYEFLDAAQYYGPNAIALDKNGERFTDESSTEMEEGLAQDTAKLAGGRAYYVLDQDIYEMPSLSGYAGQSVEAAEKLGGRVVKCDTIAELGAKISEWGGLGHRVVSSVITYNEGVRDRNGPTLVPPRAKNRHPIDTPPYYAVEVQPGITFTMGGLSVNSNMEVLRRSTSSSSIDAEYVPADIDELSLNPIPGLYAAGVDVGNISNRQYQSGLSQALVTGIIAADRATA